MTYDYSDRHKTSMNAPLLQDDEHNHRETVEGTIERALSENCGAEKLVLGISTYATVYRLKMAMRNHIGAAAAEMGDVEGNEVDGGGVGYEKVR
jgi:hypothetical protein